MKDIKQESPYTSQVGNFGDNTESQMKRMFGDKPLPDFSNATKVEFTELNPAVTTLPKIIPKTIGEAVGLKPEQINDTFPGAPIAKAHWKLSSMLVDLEQTYDDLLRFDLEVGNQGYSLCKVSSIILEVKHLMLMLEPKIEK